MLIHYIYNYSVCTYLVRAEMFYYVRTVVNIYVGIIMCTVTQCLYVMYSIIYLGNIYVVTVSNTQILLCSYTTAKCCCITIFWYALPPGNTTLYAFPW